MTTTKTALRTALIAGASFMTMAGAANAQTSGQTPRPTPKRASPRWKPSSAALSSQIADLKAATAASLKDVRATQSATTVSIAGGKPTIASGDGAFSANIHAVMQLDAAQYYQDKRPAGRSPTAATSTAAPTSAAPAWASTARCSRTSTTACCSTSAARAPTAPGTLQELWLQYNYAPFKVKVGAFAPNVGLEDAASTNGSLFPERPSGSEAARGLAGADRRIACRARPSASAG
jgi:phosphate-selective porin OprO/OprP